MAGKLIGLSLAVLLCDALKLFCAVKAGWDAGNQFYYKTSTHSWSYYLILIALSFSFSQLQNIFRKGAIDEQEFLAKSKN